MIIGADTTFLVQVEIRELPQHARADELLRSEVIEASAELALAPQVLTEFLHIITDARRFEQPLSMTDALTKARFWWNAREVRHVYPTAESTSLFFEWRAPHQLGRKRLLDTHLAATFWAAGIRRVLTSNARDFSIFPGFELVMP
ncbi:MAG TPA: hypothetical protein VGM03_04775 [Phycisphaerae bacterium]|jgi:predicted nucleic acid-binding protein